MEGKTRFSIFIQQIGRAATFSLAEDRTECQSFWNLSPSINDRMAAIPLHCSMS